MVYTPIIVQLSKFYYYLYLYNSVFTQKLFTTYYCSQITNCSKLYQHSICLIPYKYLCVHHLCKCKKYCCLLPYHLFLSLRESHFSHHTIMMTQSLCYLVCQFFTQLLNNLMFSTLPKIATKQLFGTLSKNIIICLFGTLPKIAAKQLFGTLLYDKILLFCCMVFIRISLMLMAIVK